MVFGFRYFFFGNMTDCCDVKSHKEWRRIAKKMRRKRIRQRLAECRKAEEKLRESSPTYLTELAKERLLEEYELEKYEREREERHEKWLRDEEEAQRLWREQERLRALAREEKLKELERIRIEWEAEQKKIREKKAELERLQREEEKRKQETLDRINDFIANGGEVPVELTSITETNPGKEICSFFSKNHCTEYDTDIGLEFEDSDMYLHFKEFYNDVVPELKSHGKVKMVKVCCNTENHLRGNVYVEYKTLREALIAYRKFQGRWYGGKQLNLIFVNITDWGSAVCGDFARRRCPKGKSCNFLHVFRNPKNEFPIEWNRSKSHRSARDSFDDGFDDSPARDQRLRWSESPVRTEERSRKKYKHNGCRRRSRSRERRRESKNRDEKKLNGDRESKVDAKRKSSREPSSKRRRREEDK